MSGLKQESRRGQFLCVHRQRRLDRAVLWISVAYDGVCYLVGSALERADFRDVDVRLILDDEDFAREFPLTDPSKTERSPKWTLICAALSELLGQQTGLPIDFQIQERSWANATYPRPRSALGVQCRLYDEEHSARVPEDSERRRE